MDGITICSPKKGKQNKDKQDRIVIPGFISNYNGNRSLDDGMLIRKNMKKMNRKGIRKRNTKIK